MINGLCEISDSLGLKFGQLVRDFLRFVQHEQHLGRRDERIFHRAPGEGVHNEHNVSDFEPFIKTVMQNCFSTGYFSFESFRLFQVSK